MTVKMRIVLLSLGLAGIATAGNEVITIECRQIEAPRAEVNKLISAKTFTLSPEQLRTINGWVGQKKAAILAQPRISTINGAQAQIRSVREYRMMPSSYDRSQATSGITYCIPLEFRTREVGKILNVTPTIVPDGIAITLVPETSNPNSTNEFRFFRLNGKTGYSQPNFSVQNQQTSVVVQDGATVLLAIGEQLPAGKEDKTVLFLLSAAVHKFQ